MDWIALVVLRKRRFITSFVCKKLGSTRTENMSSLRDLRRLSVLDMSNTQVRDVNDVTPLTKLTHLR